MLSVSIHRDSPPSDIICLGAEAGERFEHEECFRGRFTRGGRRDMFKSNPLNPYTWSS